MELLLISSISLAQAAIFSRLLLKRKTFSIAWYLFGTWMVYFALLIALSGQPFGLFSLDLVSLQRDFFRAGAVASLSLAVLLYVKRRISGAK
jgi:hypothetical protein